MVVKMSEKLFVVKRHSAKRWQKKEKKIRTFRFMQKSSNNEADQNRLFCQKLRRATEGEITNK